MSEAREAVLEAIFARRSIRQYTDDSVSQQDVQTVLEAGRWAPSGLNNQPWRFAVVRDSNVKEEIAKQVAEKIKSNTGKCS